MGLAQNLSKQFLIRSLGCHSRLFFRFRLVLRSPAQAEVDSLQRLVHPPFPREEWAALNHSGAVQKLLNQVPSFTALNEWPTPEDWQEHALLIDDYARLNLRFALEEKPGQRARRKIPKNTLRSYERWIFESGDIPTRAKNLHDFFNALIWVNFPRAKFALHKKALVFHTEWQESEHYQAGKRSPLQDRLTCFDEGGVVFELEPGDDTAEIRSLLQSRDDAAKEVFVRSRVSDFTLFGHGILEALMKRRIAGEIDLCVNVSCVILEAGEGSRDERLARYLEAFDSETPDHGTLLVNWLLDTKNPQIG